MRIWCLSSLILETYNDPEVYEDFVNNGKFRGFIDRHFVNGKICSIADSIKMSPNYVLSEIRIGKRNNQDFYFVLCRQGVKIFQLRMQKDALKILPRKYAESTIIDILTDEEREWDAPSVLGNTIKRIRIRAIKGTNERLLTSTEAELYKEYAERINLYTEGNTDKHEEAFQHFGPLNLPNQKEKFLKQKIRDLYSAITDLCHKGLEDISVKARYNNLLFDNEIYKFCPGQYDVKYEETKDFYGCRLLFYVSINLGAINERWFLAEGLQTLSLTNTDIFKNSSSWDIFERNIGKLQQLKVLEFNLCKISEIPENVYQALPPSIESLLLPNNNLTTISPTVSKLVNLQTLSVLNNKNFPVYGMPWAELPKSLSVVIYNTKIKEIPYEIQISKKILPLFSTNFPAFEFDDLSHIMQKLVISEEDILEESNIKHEISVLDDSMSTINISISVQEREQHLSNRNISSFTFEESHYCILTVLTLHNNKIEFVDWDNLPVSLKEMDFSSNFITEITSVRNMHNLTQIMLQNNKITKISADFNQLRNLEIIDLSNNQLAELPEGFELIEANSLTLNLSHNKFTYEDDETLLTLHKNLWDRLPKTDKLSLNKNTLFELPCQLAGRIEKVEAMDCDIKYICPQIYRILFDPEYVSHNRRKQRIYLNIAKNNDLTTFSFIPFTIFPTPKASELKTDEHLDDLEYDMFGILNRTKDSAIWSTMVSNNKNLNRTDVRKVVYEFTKVEETAAELKTMCKCCAYCIPENAKTRETAMIEQVMTMSCTLVVANEELLQKFHFFMNKPGWHAGKWKAMIRTRLCEECIINWKEKAKNLVEKKQDFNYLSEQKKEETGDKVHSKRQRVDFEENEEIHQILKQLKFPQNTIDTFIYADPQTSTNLQITVALHYCYPSEHFLREICKQFDIPFHKYLFNDYQIFYNSSLHDKVPSYYGGIDRDEHSGYKSLSLLLTGSHQSYNLIQNILYNHLYLSDLHQNFYSFYSEPLALPTMSLRECDLYAAANLFKINIFVFNFNNDKKWFLINESRFESPIGVTNFIHERPTFLLSKTVDYYFDAVFGISKPNEKNLLPKPDDDIQITKIILQSVNPENHIMPIFRNIEIKNAHGNFISAKLYDFKMPLSTSFTQSDFFIPPNVEQIQHYLFLLNLPLEFAYNSPLLTSAAIELEGKSMITINTLGDGNCGYRSLSTLFTGIEDYHWHIRLKIYEYIIANGHRIYGIRNGEIVNGYFEKFERLRNIPPRPVSQDLYAGNDDYYALADMLECNVYTYTPNPAPSYPHVSPHFKDNIKIDNAPTLFLIYLNNNHYEPIVAFK